MQWGSWINLLIKDDNEERIVYEQKHLGEWEKLINCFEIPPPPLNSTT